MRQSAIFLGNDRGLAHVAAGVRTRRFVLFGPTDVSKNMVPMDHVHVIKGDLDRQPCEFGGKY